MSRDTRTAYRARAAAAERSVDEALADVRAAEATEAARRAAAFAERTNPVPFTDEELKAARVIRTRFGWAPVIRVNAKTVTAAGAFGDDRVPIGSILEVKS